MDTSNPTAQTWAIVAAYITSADAVWLDDLITEPLLTFKKIPAPGIAQPWHLDRSKVTGLSRWRGHFRQVRAAFAIRPRGIITSFPQPAMLAGAINRLQRKRCRLIAYTFNLGGFPGGWRQRIARFAAAGIDYFVVHSPSEIAPYAAYLGIPEDRIVFAPLQRGAAPLERMEDTTKPFAVALGSAHRDYPTLIAAADRLQIPTIIVTRPSDIADLPKSDWVSFQSGLTQKECYALLASARICVTPISNLKTASGQITFIDSLRFGVTTVATRCPGTDGYVLHDENGLLVNPFDVDDLAEKMAAVWGDADLRTRLTTAAVAHAQARFTDQAAADMIHELIKRTQSGRA